MSAIENTMSSVPRTVRTFGVSWPLLIAFVALVGVLFGDRSKTVLADADTYWHVATGRWIIDNHAVPRSDFFSHSVPGIAWTPHEWLSQVVLAGVHELSGWTGLVVLVGLLLSGTLAYVMRFLLSRMEPAHALLFTALTAGMLMTHLLARPHALAWPVFAVWVGTLVHAGEHGRRPPWWLLPLMIVWANLHASFILGLAVGGVLAVEAVWCSPSRMRPEAASRWAVFVVFAFVASMITPSGWEGVWYPVQVMDMTYFIDVIEEWFSPNFHKLQSLEVWLALILAIACSGRMRLPLLRLVLLLGLVHLGLKHQRLIPILGLVTPFLMASPLAVQWRATTGKGRDLESADRIFGALAVPAQRSAIAIAALLATVSVVAVFQSGGFVPSAERTPEAAVGAAKAAGARGPVLNSYGFGGFLIFRGIPVFIDGRSDMYGDALLKRYVEALQLKESDDLLRLLADYRIGWTLLEPGTPALALLDRLPEWRRVYADAVAVVHVRGGDTAR